MQQEIALDRVLFASDFPGLSAVMGLGEWVGVFRRLPDMAADAGFDVTEAEVDAIPGGNARRILGRGPAG